MNHDEVIARIGQLADQTGVVRWAYFPSSVRVRGHRGLPDLLLAGPGGIAFAEIKTGSGALEPGQIAWRDTLLASGAAWHLWWPAALYDGSVDRELRRLAAKSQV